MAKKFEYIQSNMKILHKLFKGGDISGRVMAEYHIYMVYKGFSSVKSKMERYQFTAEQTKTSIQTVMKAVKNMEKTV